MNLSKRDALFLYKTLYHFSVVNPDFDEMTSLEDLSDRLENFLLSSSDLEEDEEREEEEDTSSDDDEEEDTEKLEADDTLLISDLNNLSSLRVETPDGSKATLEFEDVGDLNSIDALIDGGDVIIDSVTHIKATSSSIELFDGEEWHSYGYKRLTKQWSDLLEVDTVYDVEATQ